LNNPYIVTDENKIISFNLCKVNKGKEKLCKCKTPHYEVDTVNRIVMCIDCGAVIDAFDVLVTLTERMILYTDYQRKAHDKSVMFGEMADKELKRRMKNSIFKEMEAHYLKDNCHPHCPVCNAAFDPVKITRWSRASMNGGS